MSMLKTLKKYNRKLYEQLESTGMSNAFKAPKIDAPPKEPKHVKFTKLKAIIGKK